MASSRDIPDGFAVLDSNSPFNNLIGPLYSRTNDDGVVLGLLVEERHCNSSGRLHGSMICAIADFAIGHNVGLALSGGKALPRSSPGAAIATVSLTTDFVGAAKLGEWVECRVDVQRAGGSLAFANAYLHCDGERISRSNAIFKVMRRRAASESGDG